MATLANPALEQFIATLGTELKIAQVLITRVGGGYELRHLADRERAPDELRLVPVAELRSLAQVTAAGAFRPLKAAPTLQSAWRAIARDAGDLDAALNHLYPGAVADWCAAQATPPPVTHYREFAGRQTGMYRATQLLDDAQAARVAAACCHRDFCLKRRLWTVGALPADAAADKCLIPCLEPCAVLLEFARKALRLEQEEKVRCDLAGSEVASLAAALETAIRHADATAREADFNAPGNPRRLRLLLEKLASIKAASRQVPEE